MLYTPSGWDYEPSPADRQKYRESHPRLIPADDAKSAIAKAGQLWSGILAGHQEVHADLAESYAFLSLSLLQQTAARLLGPKYDDLAEQNDRHVWDEIESVLGAEESVSQALHNAVTSLLQSTEPRLSD